jgi:hypothetical protein
MFCTVLDTSSRVSNFSPVKGSDPSLRESLTGDLFPPFTQVMSFDLWWHGAARLELPPGAGTQDVLSCARTIIRTTDDCDSISSPGMSFTSSEDAISQPVGRRPLDAGVTLDVLSSFEFNMVFGRPIFYPFYLNLLALGSNARYALVTIAMCKLLDIRAITLGHTRIGPVANPDWADKALSLAGVLLALDISPKSETASTLASAFMRPIAAISTDREQVFTLMTAEPLLALAARLLVSSLVVSWDLILQALIAEEFKANHVMVGFRGEVAAQIIFTAAWQAAVARLPEGDNSEANSFPCVSAYDFLDSLLGTQLVNDGIALGLLEARLEGDTRTGFERFVADACFSVLFDVPAALSSVAWRTSVENQLDALIALWWEGADDETVLERAAPLFAKCRVKVNVMQVLELFCTYRTLVPLADRLRGGFVRLNQFVKTFSPPSLSMLRDFFLRGAGIYCMERQQVVDLAVTVHFPSKAAGGTCHEETMSVIVAQVKLQRNFLSRKVKEAWLSTVPSLGLSGAGGGQTPFVAIFMEFGHFEKYVEEPGSVRIRPVYSSSFKPADESPIRKTRKMTTTRAVPDIIGFGIFTKRPRLSEILPAGRYTPQTDVLLRKLLVSAVDPASSASVATRDRAAVSQMFRDLVYYSGKNCLANKN